jgi:hypothetical protein
MTDSLKKLILVFFSVAFGVVAIYAALFSEVPSTPLVEVPEDSVGSDTLTEEEFVASLAEIYAEESLVGVNGYDVSGTVKLVSSSDNVFELVAESYPLPLVNEEFFYEGWLVRPDGTFITTEALYLQNSYEDNTGFYRNDFDGNTDYSQFSKFIITLEPNDGDPAPAEHVAEADL